MQFNNQRQRDDLTDRKQSPRINRSARAALTLAKEIGKRGLAAVLATINKKGK